MAYTMKTEGMDEISRMLSQLGESAQAAASAGLYEGAGVMAGEMAAGVASIRTAPFKYTVFGTRAPSPEEKAVLEGAVGIAKFDKNGSEVDTSVGFASAGYAEVAGRRKPIAQIANAINSGTSFMQKQPFVRKTVRAGSKKAEAAIVAAIEKRIDEITK